MKTLSTELKTGDKGFLNDQEAIYNEFNQFFANIGKKLFELISSVTKHLSNNIEVTTKYSFFSRQLCLKR